MLKWEYYKRFKERFKKFAFMENISNISAFAIFIILKIIQGLFVFCVASSVKDFKYATAISCLVILTYLIIDLRDAQTKIKSLVLQNSAPEFYRVSCGYSEKQIALGIVLSEVLWGASDIIVVYMPFILVLFQGKFTVAISVCVSLISILCLQGIKIVFLYNYYQKISKKVSQKDNVHIIMKTIFLSICIWLGACVSDFIVSCPLHLKKDVLLELQKWLKSSNQIVLEFKMEQAVMIIKCIAIIFFFSLLKKIIKKGKLHFLKSRHPKAKIFNYAIYRDNNLKIRDFGFFFLLFIGVFMGILYGKGCNDSEFTVLVGGLMVSYTVPWMLDDMLSFHDELLIDYDGKKLYMWKGNMDIILYYKFITFLENYVFQIIGLYVMAYIFTFNEMLDITYWICNIVILMLFLCIGFVRKNIAISNSPQKISYEYEQIKYNSDRVLENNVIGEELIILSILVAIPGILLACKDIDYIQFWVFQIVVVICLSIYLVMCYIKLKNTIQKTSWIMNLFDEETSTNVDRSC